MANSLPEPFLSTMYVHVCVPLCVFMCLHVCDTLMWGNNGSSLNELHSGATQPVPVWRDHEPAISSFFHITRSLSLYLGLSLFSRAVKAHRCISINHRLWAAVPYPVFKV